MQSAPSVLRAAYRIVFRRGSPQRIHYSTAWLLLALGAFLLFALTSQLLFFRNDPVQTGLFLFLSLAGVYLGAALLTRRVPRGRLRSTLLAVLVILACSQLVLTLAAPLAGAPQWARAMVSAAVGLAVLSGVSNSVQFALAGPRKEALILTVVFAVALVALYGTLYPLLEIVFS